MDSSTEDKTYIYTRNKSLRRDECEKEYASLYQSAYSAIFPSGLCAIMITLQTFLFGYRNSGEVCLYPKECYCDTKSKVFRKLKLMYPGIHFVLYNFDNIEELIKKHEKEICCIYTESVSNPRGYMFNWNIARKFNVIVDNTWMTGKLFNPLTYGAIAVVETCSKYLSNSKCIAGAMCTNDNPLWENIFLEIRTYGLNVSDYKCQIIIDGIQNLDKNLENISLKTKEVIKSLNNVEVVHPTLPNHPTYQLYQKYIKSDLVPGVILFGLKYHNIPKSQRNWKEPLLQMIRDSGIKVSTSFGKEYDLIDAWPFKLNGKMWFRLSIGSNDNGDIVQKLKLVVKNFKKFDKSFM